MTEVLHHPGSLKDHSYQELRDLQWCRISSGNRRFRAWDFKLLYSPRLFHLVNPGNCSILHRNDPIACLCKAPTLTLRPGSEKREKRGLDHAPSLEWTMPQLHGPQNYHRTTSLLNCGSWSSML